jgi:hypothetical protein
MKKTVTMLLVVIMTAVFSGVSAQTVDSVRIDSISTIGLNPMNSVRIHVHYFGVSPSGSFRINYGINPNVNDSSTVSYPASGSDTTSKIINGLMPSTLYLFKVVFYLPAVKESPIKSYTTSACSFIANFTDITISDCKHRLEAIQAGGTYKWEVNGIIFATTQFVDVNSSNNFTLTETIGGCSSSVTKNVTVPGITVSITATSTSVCEESPVTLYGHGAQTYTWTSSLGTMTGDSITLTLTGNTTITLIGTSNGCTSTPTTQVINVNPKPKITEFTSSEDSICNNNVHPIILNGKSTGATQESYSGEWVIQNYFLPDSTFIGASDATYTATSMKGCIATAIKTLHVIGSPVVIRMHFIGKTFSVEGWFPYPIEIKIGGVVYHTSEQNSSQALFDGISLNEKDGVIVKSIIGGCFVLNEFHFGLGIDEMNPDSYIKTGTIIDVYTVSGMRIKSLDAPRELRSNSEMDNLLKDFLPNGAYLWRSNSGRTIGKSVIVSWR